MDVYADVYYVYVYVVSIIVTLSCFNRQLKTKNGDERTKMLSFGGMPVMYVLGTLLNQGDACSQILMDGQKIFSTNELLPLLAGRWIHSE